MSDRKMVLRMVRSGGVESVNFELPDGCSMDVLKGGLYVVKGDMTAVQYHALVDKMNRAGIKGVVVNVQAEGEIEHFELDTENP